MRTYATTAEHQALAPPTGGHWGVPTGLAVAVHVLLAVALAWGVSWRDETEPSAVSAELWSRLPQEAAALPVAPPPPAVRPPAEVPDNADIALRQREKEQRAKEQRAKEQREKAQREREEARRVEQARQQQAAKERAAKAAQEKAAQDKAKAEQARQQAQQQQRLAQQQAEAEKKRREEAVRKERAEAKQAEARKKTEQSALDKNRDEQIRRQMAQLGNASANSGSGGAGRAAQSSGPSAGYGAKVAARIRPNIRFDDDLPGNPVVELRVRTAPDGTIVSRTVHTSSGHPAWDQAALRAIDRTANLPRDTDGRVPSDLIIELRPKDQ